MHVLSSGIGDSGRVSRTWRTNQDLEDLSLQKLMNTGSGETGSARGPMPDGQVGIDQQTVWQTITKELSTTSC